MKDRELLNKIASVTKNDYTPYNFQRSFFNDLKNYQLDDSIIEDEYSDRMDRANKLKLSN